MVPGVLGNLVSILAPPRFRSYGLNFLLESNVGKTENAGVWMGLTFLNEGLITDLDLPLSSDAITFSFEKGAKRHTISLQVIDGTKILVNANASEDIDALPSTEQLENELTSGYQSLIDLLKKVGLE